MDDTISKVEILFPVIEEETQRFFRGKHCSAERDVAPSALAGHNGLVGVVDVELDVV